MGFPSTISSFTILPTSYSGKATHYIYAREHKCSKKHVNKALPEGRTLFLVNVPVDATERELTLFFKWAGLVERVVFDLDEVKEVNNDESDEEDAEEVVDGTEEGEGMEDGTDESDDEPSTSNRKKSKTKPTKPQIPTIKPLPSISLRTLRQTGRTAYIVFLEPSSLARVLSPAPTLRPWPHTPSDAPSGLAHYKALYLSLRPPLDAVRAYADSALEVYDYEQEKKKQKSEYKKGEAIVDEDGFTLVTRGGAYGKTLGGGVGVAMKGWAEGEAQAKKKKKKASKEGMYAFQKHERNRNREWL